MKRWLWIVLSLSLSLCSVSVPLGASAQTNSSAPTATVSAFNINELARILETGRQWWATHTYDSSKKTGVAPYAGRFKDQFNEVASLMFPNSREVPLYQCDYQSLSGGFGIVITMIKLCRDEIPFGLSNSYVVVDPAFVTAMKELIAPAELHAALDFVAAHELSHFVQDAAYDAASIEEKKRLLKPANGDYFNDTTSMDFIKSHAQVDALAFLALRNMNRSTNGAKAMLDLLSNANDPDMAAEARARLQYLKSTFN